MKCLQPRFIEEPELLILDGLKLCHDLVGIDARQHQVSEPCVAIVQEAQFPVPRLDLPRSNLRDCLRTRKRDTRELVREDDPV